MRAGGEAWRAKRATRRRATPSRTIAGVCVAVAALAASGRSILAADPAVADGIPVGAWILQPLVSASYGYDSNIFLQSSVNAPKADDIGRLRAALRAALPFRNSVLVLSGAQDWRYYRQNPLSQNGNTTLGARLLLNFSSRDSLDMAATGVDGVADAYVFDPGGEVAFTGEPFRYVQAQVALQRDVYGKRGYLLRITPQRMHFDRQVSQAFFDYEGFGAEGEYREPISPRTWLIANAETRRFDHFCYGTDPDGNPCPGDAAPFRKEHDDLVYLGVRGGLAREQAFYAKVGWGAYRFDPSNGSDYRGPLGEGSISLSPSPSSRFTILVARRVYPSFYFNNNYYLWDMMDLGYEFNTRRRWSTGVELTLSRNLYPDPTPPDYVTGGAPRRDRTARLEAYANLLLGDRWGLRISTILQQRRSNDINSEYRGASYLAGIFFGWN